MERQRITELENQLEQAMGADRPRLKRQLSNARTRAQKGQPVDRALERLTRELSRSVALRERRAANRPTPTYPEELPVSGHRAAIVDAVRKNQVVIVAGETGSGKTTQLPKMCLEAGRGIDGMIGHTQPRRIAARTLADRIAEELGTDLGTAVGYKVRFSDQTRPETFIKVMTDGILLAETRGDRGLHQYNTILLDEAHERSLNIDFLLGYLKNLLPERPDLKVIITSATIDTARFAAHFDDAPVIEVSGRTWPVEVRYRPAPDDEGRESVPAILRAVDETGPDGDVLVFLSGERKIHEVADALKKHHPPETEIVPLYARLSAAEQGKVFRPGARRRIVLATNVAETSLTVPRIRYVVDPGYARISRYNARAGVQRLPVEAVSRASADQRKGRCGRVAEGICIRLFDEEDFNSRPEFTAPEILRTGLAAVILRMLDLNLGEIADFPFVDPPDRRQIAEGYKLLAELGAVDSHRRITAMGRQLAGFNVDPRLARMIVAAGKENCLAEVLVITAALSIQDPRERPAEKKEKADQAHAPFKDEKSDFVSFLNLWRFFEDQSKHLSQNKMRKACKEKYLSYPRLREWRDIHRELSRQVKEAGHRLNQQPATYEELHRALLAGLLSRIGEKREKKEYTGARQADFMVFPSSGQYKKPPQWIMAAELVETERRYARVCAAVEPDMVEKAAGKLVTKSHFDPRWDARRGAVVAWEKVTLFGLVLVPQRRVQYGPVNPAEAREIFIRHALVEGDWGSRAPFFVHNKKQVAEAEAIAAKFRDAGAGVNRDALFAFFDARIPEGISDGRAFDRWRKDAERDHPQLLFLSKDDLSRTEDETDQHLYPDHLDTGGVRLALSYHFQLGHKEDGVTARVPLHALPGLSPARCEWLVPGMLRDKVGFLLKGLPKRLRKHFMPWPHWAGKFVEAVAPSDTSLTTALSDYLLAETGQQVTEADWNLQHLPDHLFMRFVVIGENGRQVGQGRHLPALQEELGHDSQVGFEQLDKSKYERERLTEWSMDDLPEQVFIGPKRAKVAAFPALVDEGDTVALRLFPTRAEARMQHDAGVLKLAALALAPQMRQLKKLALPRDVLLAYAPLGTAEALRADIIHTVLVSLFLPDGVAPRDGQVFAQRLEQARGKLAARAAELAALAGKALSAYHPVMAQLARHDIRADEQSLADLTAQVQGLVYGGFVGRTPPRWLKELPRYLRAAEKRLERMDDNPQKDRKKLAELAPLLAAWEARESDTPETEEFRWLLEELRVSLFAQELGTSVPVSAKKLEKRWREKCA